ncbi:MAG: FecR domain-containing protein [Proteobacteria bacterium]|nr:FecR domain-containing protein [Pseudomonadota bacterium]HQR04846.1 FecR family protein [Rhodocyclaceae bacterium]
MAWLVFPSGCGHVARAQTIRTFAAVLSLLASTLCSAASGTLDFITGHVTLEHNGHVQTAFAGADVEEGDTVICGDDGEAHLDMIDGGALAVRPNSKLRIENYQASDSGEKVVLRLLTGATRSITGWIAKVSRSEYHILTPTATIGVRGTDHEVMVDESGTYSSVNEGSVGMRGLDESREQIVNPGTAAFANRTTSRPLARSALPARFLRVSRFENRFSRKFSGPRATQRIVNRLGAHLDRLRKTHPEAAKRIEQHLQKEHPNLHEALQQRAERTPHPASRSEGPRHSDGATPVAKERNQMRDEEKHHADSEDTAAEDERKEERTEAQKQHEAAQKAKAARKEERREHRGRR